jgi:hypothetical protein
MMTPHELFELGANVLASVFTAFLTIHALGDVASQEARTGEDKPSVSILVIVYAIFTLIAVWL